MASYKKLYEDAQSKAEELARIVEDLKEQLSKHQKDGYKMVSTEELSELSNYITSLETEKNNVSEELDKANKVIEDLKKDNKAYEFSLSSLTEEYLNEKNDLKMFISRQNANIEDLRKQLDNIPNFIKKFFI